MIHLDSMTLPKEVFITRKFNMMFFDENGVAMHKTINLDEFERVWDMEKLERRGCTCKIGDKERQKASEERSEEDSENEKKHEPPEIELEGRRRRRRIRNGSHRCHWRRTATTIAPQSMIYSKLARRQGKQ